MPKVGDYSKCKIYKVTSLNHPDLVYHGHTCDTLSRRFSCHKRSNNKLSSKAIIEKGDAIIILVEDYSCENKDQAKAREAFYILNNPCVNKNIPGRTAQESVKAWENHTRKHIRNIKWSIRKNIFRTTKIK